VGKEKEMSSAEVSLTYEEEVGERPHSDGDSHRNASHMNEDDENLQNFVIEEEDQRSFMIVGGVEIFIARGL
jgi:hypothetical protein